MKNDSALNTEQNETGDTPSVPKRRRRRGGHTTVRRRLLFAFAVPVLVIAAVTGIQYQNAGQRADDVANQVALARSTGGPTALVTAITDERDVTGVEMVGLLGSVELPSENAAAARKRTDEQVEAFTKALASNTPEVRRIFQPALEGVEVGLRNARMRMDRSGLPQDLQNTDADVVFSQYSDVVDTIAGANRLAVQQIDDAELRNIATAVADTSTAADAMSRMARAVAFSGFQGVEMDGNALLSASELFSSYQSSKANALRLVSDVPGASTILSRYFNRPSQRTFESQARTFLVSGEMDLNAIIDSVADQSPPSVNDAWAAMSTALNNRADHLVNEANTAQRTALGVLLITVTVVIGLALYAARSLSRPLVQIADEANTMAEKTLPDTIAEVLATPVGHDLSVPTLPPASSSSIAEIDGVADSLNSIQDRSLLLAIEQAGLRRRFAESFAALGQRVKDLIESQIETLDQLESTEEDPDELAKLFKLDHTATRVRRNAESLIMLAGPEGPIRRFVADPWPALDVVRVAAQSTDDYARVVPGDIDDALFAGWAGESIANILSELADNAIEFAPEGVPVKVSGRLLPSGGYLFKVIDNGGGMTRLAMAAANRRLSGEESFTEAPSTFLGHFVIGHIARRIGAKVGVEETTGGGVTATFHLPAELVQAGGPPMPPSTPEPSPESATGRIEGALPARRTKKPATTKLSEALVSPAPPNSEQVENIAGLRRHIEDS